MLTITGGSLGAGTVSGGVSFGPGAGAGRAYGDGIFLQENQSITLGAAAGQTQIVSGVIADMTGSQDSSGLTGAGSLVISAASAGTVEFTAANTYTGGTVISAGILSVSGAGTTGSGSVTVLGGAALLISSGGRASGLTVASGGTAEVSTAATSRAMS